MACHVDIIPIDKAFLRNAADKKRVLPEEASVGCALFIRQALHGIYMYNPQPGAAQRLRLTALLCKIFRYLSSPFFFSNKFGLAFPTLISFRPLRDERL